MLGSRSFGIYHGFSYGILGNPVMMAFVMELTGAFGQMLALAYATAKSIALPIGLHLGWNLVPYVGSSVGPLGPGLFVPGNGAARLEGSGLPSLLLNLELPLLLVAVVCGYLLRVYPRSSTRAQIDPAMPEPSPACSDPLAHRTSLPRRRTPDVRPLHILHRS